MNREEILKQLTAEFKNLKTYAEFKAFEKKVYETGFGFYSKRRNVEAMAFSNSYMYRGQIYTHAEGKVNYLYNDSVSSGVSEVKNLYRHLRIM